MQEYNDLLEREQFLTECIETLEKVNKRLAKLNAQKEELTKDIIGALGHEHDGQKSYNHGIYKVEVKTPCNYSLDKSAYESGNYSLPEQYNPIKESVSYRIDKKLCDEAMEKAPKRVQKALSELIEKKPGKPSVTIKMG